MAFERRNSRRRARPSRLALLPVFVVLGLFAMHGLGGHGANGDDGQTALALSGADAPDTHPVHADVAVGVVDQALGEGAPHAEWTQAAPVLAHAQTEAAVDGIDPCSCPESGDGHTAQHSQNDQHGGHSIAMGLCLALLGAVIVILLTSLSQRFRWHGRQHASDHGSRLLAAGSLRRREPDLIALGVCRC